MKNQWFKGFVLCAATVGLFVAGCSDETSRTTPSAAIPCAEEWDCPYEYTCDEQSGFCVPEGEEPDPGGGTGESGCVEDGDCPGTQSCDVPSGECVPGEEPDPGGETPCVGDGDCEGVLVCDVPSGECVPGEEPDPGGDPPCVEDGDCADELVCDVPSGECVPDDPVDPGCVNDGDCPQGQICDELNDRCVPEPGDGSCPLNGDGDAVGDDRCEGMTFDGDCVIDRPGDNFTPDEKWHFRVDTAVNLPYQTYDRAPWLGHKINQVMMTPVVIDLQLDNSGVPNVIFTTFATNENPNGADELITGVLRAIDGDDGSHRWSVGYKELSAFENIPESQWRSQYGFAPAGSVAAGVISDGGKPVVIAAISDYNEGKKGLVAVNNDGTIRWISDKVPNDSAPSWWWWGGPSIADLDGDGTPEIIFGASVFDNEGTLLWEGKNAPNLNDKTSSGSNSKTGPLSVVADLTREPDPNTGRYTQEVITGNAAFKHDGTLLWEVDDPALKEGYPAVADFDGDGLPEVVVVSEGTVRIHDGREGHVVWGPVRIHDAGRLGPPTIADMTGDGRLEIGVAGEDGYFALRVDYGLPGANNTPTHAEAEAWTNRAIVDASSSTTGSSVFDFNGDGSASVVYNDEYFLYVLDGKTGEPQFMAPNPSFTAVEYPVIADVNNDGRANIIVASSDYECGDRMQEDLPCEKGSAGIRVFGDADDNWVPTRRIWNQHAYSINNVNEDGTIPAQPTPNYLDHNTFRLNTLTELDPKAAPDLAPGATGFGSDGCWVGGSVWVVNRGAARVGAGVPVAVYAVKAGSQQRLKILHTQGALEPGEAERVAVSVEAPDGEGWRIKVVVNDDGTGEGTRKECNEDNNEIFVLDGISCI